MGNNVTPAVAQQGLCKIGSRCHVSGKGIRMFGSKFPQPEVLDLASSSVQLVTPPARRLGSGTLIDRTVVLCAAHTLATVSAKDVEILIHFECNAQTAPPGAARQYPGNSNKWRACTKLATVPQAKVIKVLEQGHGADLDYALLAIEWKNAVPSPAVSGEYLVKLPRIPSCKPGRWIGKKELLLIGHPWDPQRQGEPAQASAGVFRLQDGPHPDTLKGDDYGYASFAATDGFSGGGVFSTRFEFVGLLKGARNKLDPSTGAVGPAFLQLGKAADETHEKHHFKLGRLSLWLKGARPLRPGDPDQNVVFIT